MAQGTDPGVFSAVMAYLRNTDENSSEPATKEEIEAEIEQSVGYELLYLRDRSVIEIEKNSEKIVAKLNPEAKSDAENLAEELEAEYSDDFSQMAEEHTPKFIAYPEDLNWPEPEEIEELEGSIEHQNIGELCAVLSIYGEEVLKGKRQPEYTQEKVLSQFELDGYNLEIDIEERLDVLEQLGYLERASRMQEDFYRLADDEEVRLDAPDIAEFRNEIFSGYPRNMAIAYEEADRVELENKGVRLVQKPEEIAH